MWSTKFRAMLFATFMTIPPSSAQAAPQSVVQFTGQPYGGWLYLCMSPYNGGEKPGCSATAQIAEIQNGRKKPILMLVITHELGEPYKLTVATPLAARPQRYIAVSVDQGQPTFLKNDFCRATGCFVSDHPADALVAMMRKSNEVYVQYTSLDGRVVWLSLSLNGLNSALTALDNGVLPKVAYSGSELLGNAEVITEHPKN